VSHRGGPIMSKVCNYSSRRRRLASCLAAVALLATACGTSREGTSSPERLHRPRRPPPAARRWGTPVDSYRSRLQRLSHEPWTSLHMDFRCENGCSGGMAPALSCSTRRRWAETGRLQPGLSARWQPPHRGRTVHETALVERYHRALVAGGVGDYPLDRLRAMGPLAMPTRAAARKRTTSWPSAGGGWAEAGRCHDRM
jgi:hypothetical protein